jgi:Flp pilus assembly protein TadD
LALLRAGRASEAAVALQQAAVTEPNHADVQTNLGLANMQLGRIEESAAAFRRAVALDGGNAEVRYNLAQLLAEQGRAGDAAAELRESLRLRPEWPTAMGALAWLQATQPDFAGSSAEATVALAVRAAALTSHRDPAILDALGAAYAAAGDLPAAIRTTGQALEIARASAPGLALGIRARLERYKARK